jgi:hypothetical protein
VYNGLKADVNNAIATYWIDPAKIKKLMREIHPRPYPILFISIPYPIPKNRYPVSTGIVIGNAAFKALNFVPAVSGCSFISL